MKKLLVLTLVLSVASLTSAELIITGADVDVNSGDSLTIGISSDGEEYLTDLYKLVIEGLQTEDIDAAAVNYPDKSSDLSAVYGGGPGVVFIDFSIGEQVPIWPDPDENTPVASGILLTNITGSLELNLLLAAPGSEPIDTATVNILPEPATMVVLGVGALVLRRRK